MKKLNLNLPKSWSELTDRQLYYVYDLISQSLSGAQVKTYFLFNCAKLRIICKHADGYIVKHGTSEFVVSANVIADAISALDWLDGFPSEPVRIQVIKRSIAVDACFREVPLQTYLVCDNYYQGYLATGKNYLIEAMARALYNSDSITINSTERIAIFYWWAGLKSYLSRKFPNLFKSSDPDGLGSGASDPETSMNSMIRALTKGDILKESQVLACDTHRAFTELDALAKEYNEIKKKYGKS